MSEVVQSWDGKESAARDEWQSPIEGLTVPRSGGGYYQGPRTDRAHLLADVEVALTVAVNNVYGAVADAVGECNTEHNVLDLKAADLQEQLAKAKYAGTDTTGINDQVDAVLNEQMNRPSLRYLCR